MLKRKLKQLTIFDAGVKDPYTPPIFTPEDWERITKLFKPWQSTQSQQAQQSAE